MTTARVLKMRRQGYTIPEIVRLSGKTELEVRGLIDNCRNTMPAYEPTITEIYAEAEKLRELNPRDPQGYQLGLTVEVTQASLMGGERRSKGFQG